MADPKVFFVHLRRPDSASENPNERRDDPFWEFGSFGCTTCHCDNLIHPRRAKDLAGSRFAFVQGGKLGSRLVFLTPPISVKVWKKNCEARWKPIAMPFKYDSAPILVANDGSSDFKLVIPFALEANGQTLEGRFCSKIRSRSQPLSEALAKDVVKTYERLRATASRSEMAKTYEEALPHLPPVVDRKRKETYERRVKNLERDGSGECREFF